MWYVSAVPKRTKSTAHDKEKKLITFCSLSLFESFFCCSWRNLLYCKNEILTPESCIWNFSFLLFSKNFSTLSFTYWSTLVSAHVHYNNTKGVELSKWVKMRKIMEPYIVKVKYFNAHFAWFHWSQSSHKHYGLENSWCALWLVKQRNNFWYLEVSLSPAQVELLPHIFYTL